MRFISALLQCDY